MWGSNNTSCTHFAKCLVENCLAIWQIPGINSGNIGVTVFGDVLDNFVLPLIPEENDLSLPSEFFESINNRQGVFSVSVPLFVRSSFGFEDDNSFVDFFLK